MADPHPDRPKLPPQFSPLLDPGALVSIAILGAFFLAFALLMLDVTGKL